MATKRKPTADVGPRVTNARPARGVAAALGRATYTQVLAERVRAVKQARATTWREFEERIGMTEKARTSKTIGTNPTPFTAEELFRISTEFKARPEYLLQGIEPMFEQVIVAPSGAAPSPDLRDTLYEHLVDALRARFDAMRDGITGRLPDPRRILLAIEQGVGDAWESNFERGVQDQMRVAQAVRAAVHESVREAWEPSSVTPETVEKLTRELAKSKRISPPRSSAISEASAQAREKLSRKSRRK